MSGLPGLPTDMSSDGREVFAWADALSRETQRRHRMRELRFAIADVGCGSCEHWMKSRDCPREHNINGQTRGPSSGGLICSKYTESRQSAQLRDKRRIELQTLDSQP